MLLIKYATRGRGELFKRAILNIYETIDKSQEFKILVSADSDDPTMNCPDIHGFCQPYNEIILCYDYSKSKINAINRDFNKIDFNWTWLVNMSDDMVFTNFGWNVDMLRLIREKFTDTDFFAHFNDGYVHDKLPTMSIMGREYYERFFYIYPECYGSFSCDAEAMYVAKFLGKWEYFSQVFFRHEHPGNNGNQQLNDGTYHRSARWGEKDAEVYFKRLKKMFYVNNVDPNLIPQEIKPYL